MATTIIDRIYAEHSTLAKHLLDSNEPSLLNSVDEGFRKTLVLSVASYFEVKVREILLAYVQERSAGDELTVAFLKNKAIERQYHTYFNWSDKNANQFFGLLGPAFKSRMQTVVKGDQALDQAIKAFLELGDLRNNLVHRDYATLPMEKTVEEIFELYKSALHFVDLLPHHLRGSAIPSGQAEEGTG